MIYLFISILGILITIFFVIGTHESAHFLTARMLGVKVLRFSIGFGKTLWRRFDKKGTEYVLALIPLGGYVKMLDENEGIVPKEELHLAYNRQPFYKKFLIVLAGPISNIVCALILYWLVFMIGFTTVKPIIGKVQAQSIAAKSGIHTGTQIIAVDDHKTMTWAGVVLRLIVHVGNNKQVSITTKNNADNKIEKHYLDLTTWRLDDLKPDPLSSLGIEPFFPDIPLVIGQFVKNSPAANSQLQLGDKIIAINTYAIKNWSDVTTFINKHPNEKLDFFVQRKNNYLHIPVTTSFKRTLLFQKTGYLGIGPKFTIPPSLLQKVQYGPGQALANAWDEIVNFTYLNFVLFGKMLTGKISLQSLGGPITIFETAGDALNSGFITFFGFLAFLSIAIGVVNLLPIPGLDGGHLFIQIIEFIIRRPLPEAVLDLMYRLGFLFIFLVLFQAVMNDIMRLH